MPQIKVLKRVTLLYSWKWWRWAIIWIIEREMCFSTEDTSPHYL